MNDKPKLRHRKTVAERLAELERIAERHDTRAAAARKRKWEIVAQERQEIEARAAALPPLPVAES